MHTLRYDELAGVPAFVAPRHPGGASVCGFGADRRVVDESRDDLVRQIDVT